MGLDYTSGCVNYRDVGEFINWLSGEELLPEKRILRGGSTDYVKDLKEIGNPKTIINLRKGPDIKTFGIDHLHFPISNQYEKYHTEQKEVRLWLNMIIKSFEREEIRFPILFHCLSGKDRTGIVIAALLLILGISEELIIKEYLLSEGDVKEERIRIAIDGIKSNPDYFNRLDIEKVKERLENVANSP